MNHFLDIHKTSAQDLHRIIETAKLTKNARHDKPKAALDAERSEEHTSELQSR